MGMKLGNFITPELAFAGLELPDRDAVLRFLVEQLAEAGRTTDPEGLLREVLAREDVETTGIGGGIAIPHARTDSVVGSVVMIATLATPVRFNSVDGEPADLIFFLAGARELPGQQLRVLARISKLVRIDGFLGDLRSATSPAEILHAVQVVEAKHF